MTKILHDFCFRLQAWHPPTLFAHPDFTNEKIPWMAFGRKVNEGRPSLNVCKTEKPAALAMWPPWQKDPSEEEFSYEPFTPENSPTLELARYLEENRHLVPGRSPPFTCLFKRNLVKMFSKYSVWK